ncbi:MAG: hypothetical protein KKF62_09080 [Bacteroidetes bacterium]|nr:hypothetical protein [Bacteroidota bacterium]MBU1114149.1 hypothetical protein [Bacteroidota bacterium]MBU1796826.1 hypothetical protein [Bacteroidota bacterium]
MKLLIKIIHVSFIFIGIPIISWAITNTSQYFKNHPSSASLLATIIIQIYFVLNLPQIGNSSGHGKQTIPPKRFVVFQLQVIITLILIFAPYFNSEIIAIISELDFARYLVFLFFIIAFSLINWPKIVLNKQFSKCFKFYEKNTCLLPHLSIKRNYGNSKY